MSEQHLDIDQNLTETERKELALKDELALKEKVKKNLLWVAIFSIIMLFAGITSGYIVSSGSAFWVDIKMPNQFFVSTVFIIISSLSVWGATHFIQQNKAHLIKPLLGLALFLGIGFGAFQYQGFLELAKSGNAVRGAIINIDGRYGEFFTITYENKEISFDGYNYFWEGNKIDQDLKTSMKAFCSEVMTVAEKKEQPLSNYGKFILKYKNKPVYHLNNRLELNGLSLSPEQKRRLLRFSRSIAIGSGDFVMVGVYGEDFTINYAGKPIIYKGRKFYRNDKELSAYQLNQLNTAQNQTGSFIFAFIFVHGLHWLAGIITLLVLFINALKQNYTTNNHVGLKIGAIYWHFLGILWLYLYAFLNLIH